jgi:PAS domain S-box-containing protein
MSKQISILHLEDDPVDADLIQEMISSGNISAAITRVQTREEFNESINRGGYDLILSDYKLPMFDGISAMRMAEERCPEIPFIFVSGALGEDAAIETLTRGATDYVLKSKLIRLVPAVKRAMEEQKNKQEAGRLEEMMKVRLRILETVYTKELSLDEICVMVLDEIESQTKSDVGYFIFVNEDQKNVILHSWSSNTTATMCTARVKKSHYNIDEEGAWTEAIIKKRPVIHNDHPSLPNKKGLPEGHAPVERELVVPIIRGDLIVACIGVGNKTSEYDDTDIRIVSLLGDFSWEIIRRKRAEEALKESEERYRSLVELSPEAIVVHIEGEIIYGNRASARLYGGDTPGQFIGRHVLEFVHPDHRRTVRERTLKNHKTRNREIRVEEKHIRLNGQPIDTEVTIVPIAFSGKPATLLIIEDITERKQAKERIIRERENFYKILATAPVGILLIDSDMVIQEANKTAGSIALKDPAEIINKPVGGGLGCSHSLEDPKGCGFSDFCNDCPLRQNLDTVIAKNKSIHGKEISLTLLINGKPQERWLNINIEPVTIDELKYLIVAIDDITTKKELEKKNLANLHFLEGLDRINRAMQGTNELEEMTGNVMDEVMSIFNSDRSFLLTPCDPEASSWTIPMERTIPEYPGVGVLEKEIPMDPDASYLLRTLLESDGPVTFHSKSDNPLPEKIKDLYNIKSLLSMALYPVNSKPWVFGLHQCSYERTWTREEERLFHEIGRRLEDSITTLLMYREVRTLLRELHHRTKNNMAVIVSLLEIQSRYSDDQKWHQLLLDAQGRIRSMALVHQKLYDTKELSRVNLKKYISELVAILITSYNLLPGKISLITEMDDVFVEVDYAVPCGLILNELITNVFKYAFPDDRKGTIKIQLQRTCEGDVLFSVEDDGIGIPRGFDFKKEGRMGSEIVYGLTESQLKGHVEFNTNHGVRCKIVFSDNLYKKRI